MTYKILGKVYGRFWNQWAMVVFSASLSKYLCNFSQVNIWYVESLSKLLHLCTKSLVVSIFFLSIIDDLINQENFIFNWSNAVNLFIWFENCSLYACFIYLVFPFFSKLLFLFLHIEKCTSAFLNAFWGTIFWILHKYL